MSMEKEQAAIRFQEIAIEAMETKEVKKYAKSTSGLVTVPPEWAGKTVFVILPKREETK